MCKFQSALDRHLRLKLLDFLQYRYLLLDLILSKLKFDRFVPQAISKAKLSLLQYELKVDTYLTQAKSKDYPLLSQA